MAFRPPLAMKLLAVQPTQVESTSVTPGARYARLNKLRSFNGRSLINLRSTTCPETASCVASSGACELTCTVMVAYPTCSEKFAATF